MLPNIGDEVQLTDDYINFDSSRDSLKGRKLDVLKIDLRGITSSGPSYDVWFSYDGTVDGVEDVSDAGQSNRYSVVVFQPWSGGFSPSKQKAKSEDDRCSRCGTMGEVTRMSCICPSCGHVIWGI